MTSISYSGSQANNQSNNAKNYQPLDTGRVLKIKNGLMPLTEKYYDSQGRQIQLWKSDSYSLIGSVLDQNGHLTVIPGNKIQNPLNPQESPEALVRRLENSLQKGWDLAVNTNSLILTVWPRLKAAGKDKEVRDGIQGGHSKTWTEGKWVRHIESKGYEFLRGDKHEAIWRHSKRNVEIRMDREKREIFLSRGGSAKIPNHIAREYYEAKKGAERNPYDHKQKAAAQERFKNAEGTLKNWQAKYNNVQFKLTYGRDQKLIDLTRHDYQVRDASKPALTHTTPAQKAFQQTVQQTKLIDSYNSSNPKTPIPQTGGMAKPPGGVECSIDYIEGLFDSPESLFEDQHFFYMAKAPNQSMPFTNTELQQILRELAIGIYVHDTVPFFSLHFNQNGDQFPVVHPAYKFIARVIGRLDYFMKGYLNGSVYQEKFIDDWSKNPDWNAKLPEALKNIVDLSEYCQKELQGEDKFYASLNKEGVLETLADQLGLDKSESFDFGRTSFRIIAKQKSIKKEGPVFIIDPDFDVLYTLELSPHQEQLINEYVKVHGHRPSGYQKLILSYENFCKKIHDHMVKLPFASTYFSMLSVINFFAGYFSTLKKHHRIPLLPSQEKVEGNSCPSLFPHLPVHILRKDGLSVNAKSIIQDTWNHHRDEIEKYYQSSEGKEKALQIFQDVTYRHILKSIEQQNKTTNSSSDLNNTIALASSKEIGLSLLEQSQKLWKEFNEKINRYKEKDFSKHIGDFPINIPLFITALKPSLKVTEKKIVKILGGCGMRLKKQSPQPAKEVASILASNWPQMIDLSQEEILEVGKDGVLFQLPFMHSSADHHEWMATDLFRSPGESAAVIKARKKIQNAMLKGKVEKFAKLVEEQPVDALSKMLGSDRKSLLHYASMLADPYYTKALLKKGVKADCRDLQGYLPIHYAAMKGAIAQLSLPEIAKDINATSINGSTPLAVAIQHQQVEMVRTLIQQGAALFQLIEGYNALECALHYPNEEIVEELLKHPQISSLLKVPEDSRSACEEGGNALVMACDLHSAKIVEKLLQKGAHPKVHHKNGTSPLEVAILRNDPAIVASLLKKHINLEPREWEMAFKQGSPAVIEQFLHHKYYVNDLGENALHIAIKSGNEEGALFLIEKGEARLILEKNKNEKTPFDLAASLGMRDVVLRLHKAGDASSFDLRPLFKWNYDASLKPLFDLWKPPQKILEESLLIAAKAGNFNMIREVLEPKGIEITSIKNPKNGWTYLHYLAKFDEISLFRRYITKHSDPCQPIEKEGGKTLAYIAAQSRSSRVLRFIVELMKKKNISFEKQFQEKHLFYAVLESGSEEDVEWMLKTFKDLINKDLDGKGTRAIHFAINSKSLLAMLKKMGADGSISHPSSVIDFDDAKSEAKDVHAIDKNGGTALFYAVAGNDVQKIKTLLEKGADPNHHNFLGFTPLIIACQLNNLSAIKTLIENGADINQANDQAPLHVAIAQCSDEIIQYLLSQGANPNLLINKGVHPAHVAASAGKTLVLRLLRSMKVQLDVKDSDGNQPIHYAIKSKKKEAVSFILSSESADLQLQENHPIYLAVQQGDWETVEKLLDQNLNPSTVSKALSYAAISDSPEEVFEKLDSYKFPQIPGAMQKAILSAIAGDNLEGMKLLYQKQLSINAPLSEGVTGLQFASQSGATHCTGWLLENGADPMLQNFENLNALEISAKNKNAEQFQAIIDAMYSDLDFEIDWANSKGETLMHFAAAAGNLKHILVLLIEQATIDVIDCKGYTPLHSAAKAGQAKVVSLLLACGADAGKLTQNKELAKDLAANYETKKVFEKFSRLEPSKLPLHAAIMAEDLVAFSYLLAFSDVNQKDGNGATPLHLAAKSNNMKYIFSLLQRGGDIEAKDNFGKAPRDYATDVNIISMLQVQKNKEGKN